MASSMKTGCVSVDVTAPRKDGYLDLTAELDSAIQRSGVSEGCSIAFCMHTTCTLIVNEWEAGALDDLRDRLHALVPQDHNYAHDDFERRLEVPVGERVNGRSHVATMLLGGSSQAFPVVKGRASLGRWQRLLLVELDEPKPRTIVFITVGG
jgi:secondary thiamine-phosphate synthase enzyme